MAFNFGRPLLIGDDPSVTLGRRFLQHPMSKIEDSRLVAAVELLSGRSEELPRPCFNLSSRTTARGHLTFMGPIHLSEAEIQNEVKQDNSFYEQWFAQWTRYYGKNPKTQVLSQRSERC
jgi:hypothetical protein